MKARELRIGNWVKSGKGFYKVECITSKGLEYAIADNILWSGDGVVFEPIPLTEEILLKCWFEPMQNYTFILFIERNDNIVWQSDVEICNYKHVKYLHQLQNLYFALTNEELEINL